MAELVHGVRPPRCRRFRIPIVGGRQFLRVHYAITPAPQAGDLLLMMPAARRILRVRHHAYLPVTPLQPEQRAVYDVLRAHSTRFRQGQPGNHWNDPTDARCGRSPRAWCASGCSALASLIGRYKKFFMHRAGHWLGIDVHDVGDLQGRNEWRYSRPGWPVGDPDYIGGSKACNDSGTLACASRTTLP